MPASALALAALQKVLEKTQISMNANLWSAEILATTAGAASAAYSNALAGMAQMGGSPTDNPEVWTAIFLAELFTGGYAGGVVMQGSVQVRNDDGTWTSYPAAADTDLARGAALTTALAAATSGQAVILGPGVFLSAAAFTLTAGVHLIGSGDSTILQRTTADEVLRYATGCYMAAFQVDGYKPFVATHATGTSIIINCSTVNGIDGIMNQAGGTTKAYLCRLGSGGDTAINTTGNLELHQCDLLAVASTGGLVCSSGTLKMFGGRTHGGLAAWGSGGTLSLYNVAISSDGGGSDITQAGAGVVNLANCSYDPAKVTGSLTLLTGDRAKIMVVESFSAARPIVLADAGKYLIHPAADNNARTITLPANATIAMPVGTIITIRNRAAAAVSIAITTDTLTDSFGNTGTRTLAKDGIATVVKEETTGWGISGIGLS
jgi:hypothetical protein